MNTLIMTKSLTQAEVAPVRLKYLSHGNAALFCVLYNEAFCSVDGALVMDDEAATSLLCDLNKQSGFLMVGGLPVGVFVLDIEDDPAELCALAICPEFRRNGYAKQAHMRIERELLAKGFSKVQLVVGENNKAARQFYASCGYQSL